VIGGMLVEGSCEGGSTRCPTEQTEALSPATLHSHHHVAAPQHAFLGPHRQCHVPAQRAASARVGTTDAAPQHCAPARRTRIHFAAGTSPSAAPRPPALLQEGVGARSETSATAQAKERVDESKVWYAALPRRAQAAAVGLALSVTFLETSALAGVEASPADLPGVMIGVAGALGMVRHTLWMYSLRAWHLYSHAA
jgi:hypothetical protein